MRISVCLTTLQWTNTSLLRTHEITTNKRFNQALDLTRHDLFLLFVSQGIGGLIITCAILVLSQLKACLPNPNFCDPYRAFMVSKLFSNLNSNAQWSHYYRIFMYKYGGVMLMTPLGLGVRCIV